MKTKRLLIRKFSPDGWRYLYENLSQAEVVKYEPYEVFTEDQAKLGGDPPFQQLEFFCGISAGYGQVDRQSLFGKA